MTKKPKKSGLPCWGRSVRSHAEIFHMDELRPIPSQKGTTFCLPYGAGRSYGDCCLNNGETQCPTQFLDMCISFDRENGIICAEGGISLSRILEIIVPAGWFLPVTPGTKFATLGGSIANDVHGKNHHTQGCLGNHVLNITLVRSSGEVIDCTPDNNRSWFAATIGGLGLTGLIWKATLKLIPIASSRIDVGHIPFGTIDDFFSINDELERQSDYTVAWLDSLSPSGRGVYMHGTHSREGDLQYRSKGPSFSVPLDAPELLLSKWTMQPFNSTYYYLQKRKTETFTSSIDSFFYPLDVVGDWNRLYGKRGFRQYQCVLRGNGEGVREGCRKMVSAIARSKLGSFLAVLKTFGEKQSPGLLSFPIPGVTLALDFPNHGSKTEDLFSTLDDIVREFDGRLYPAKDDRMRGEDFRRFYPQWAELETLRDPAVSSSFWRRVTNE